MGISLDYQQVTVIFPVKMFESPDVSPIEIVKAAWVERDFDEN